MPGTEKKKAQDRERMKRIRANGGWRDISTAPTDGTAFVGSNGKYAYRTMLMKHYVKWPHEEGGPTFRDAWNAEDGSSIWPWSPTLWMPLPPPSKAQKDIADE